MAKTVSIFFCSECGNESQSYLGKCPACHTWGSLKEAKFDKSSKKSTSTQDTGFFVKAES